MSTQWPAHRLNELQPRTNIKGLVYTLQGNARAADVDGFMVLLELRNDAYNALMAKHTAAQEDHRENLRQLRVRGLVWYLAVALSKLRHGVAWWCASHAWR